MIMKTSFQFRTEKYSLDKDTFHVPRNRFQKHNQKTVYLENQAQKYEKELLQ